MSQKRKGWIGLNREVRERIFRIIDDGAKGRGRPPRIDVAKHLVYVITDHCDYEDVPDQGRSYGVWRTSYSEIEELTSYNKRTAELALMYLEKQQLIQKHHEYTHCKSNKRAESAGINVPRELVISALFYMHLTTVEESFRCWVTENKRAVFKEVPPASPPLPLKSLKSGRDSDSLQDRTSVRQNSQAGRAGSHTSLNSFSTAKGKLKPTPQTTPNTTGSHSKKRTNGTVTFGAVAGGMRGQSKLVERNVIPIRDAITNASVDFRPLLNQVARLGIEEVHITPLNDLHTLHSKALDWCGDDDRKLGKTWVYNAIFHFADGGRQFGSLRELIDALKDGARATG